MKGIRCSLLVLVFVSIGAVPAHDFAYPAKRISVAQHPSSALLPSGSIIKPESASLFPAAYFPAKLEFLSQKSDPRPLSPERYAEARVLESLRLPATLNSDIVAFYGSPISPRMGILGEYPIHELAGLLKGYTELYDKVNGERGAIPAFYIIYGTCWPEGEIGILRESLVRQYVEYAQANGILVFLDHQIGKYTIAEAMERLLPWLSWPNVHLALDPEWKTLLPMEEIGQVNGEEINQAQKMMSDSIAERDLPGTRMLVIHQFNHKMIQDRGYIRTDFDKVQLIHCADGFGAPDVKKMSYRYNALAENMPLKGFKLFLKTDVPGAGFDFPLLEPSEVMALEPRPVIVMYQ